MNIKWIIIGAVALLIFIAMGNNPFEPPKGYVYEDPVKKSLRDRASGKSVSPNLWGGVPSGQASGNSNALGLPTGAPATFPTTTQKTVLPPTPTTQPELQHQPAPFQNLPTKPSSEPLPPGATLTVPPYIPLLTLASGQPIRFVGVYAFTHDEDGNIVRVKDGEYTTLNGIKITIRDGVNQWRPIPWHNKRT